MWARICGIFPPEMLIDQRQRARISKGRSMVICVWGRDHVRPCTPTPVPTHALSHPRFFLLPILIVPCPSSYASDSVWMSGLDMPLPIMLSISEWVWV
jgi:hypothetical protein